MQLNRQMTTTVSVQRRLCTINSFITIVEWRDDFFLIHTGHNFLNRYLTLRSFHYSGCLQLLEISWSLKTLLEILEISWNLNGPPGNFCVMIENFCVMMMWHCLCIEECNIKMLLML